MNNQNVPRPMPPAAVVTGNILSSVPPPSALPNFITSPAPQPQPQQSSENLIKRESMAAESTTLPTARPHTLTSSIESSDFLPTAFSPAIPASKGAPTEATGPPDSGNTSSLTSPSSVGSAHPSLQSAHEAEEYIGDPMPGSGIFTWMKGAVSTGGLLHRVAEKAKSSVDSMITTLDPQMKEYIYSGGDTEILVASANDDKVSPIREAFQNVFGKATVVGFDAQSNKVAAQPIGFAAALSSAKDRIGQLRASNSKIGNNVPIVAVENFILEVTSERWFDLGVLVLTDPSRGINLETFTQMTPVPYTIIAAAKGDTLPNYEFIETGFSNTVGSYMEDNLQIHHSNWHEATTGVMRREMIGLAAKSLATLYKRALSTTSVPN